MKGMKRIKRQKIMLKLKGKRRTAELKSRRRK